MSTFLVSCWVRTSKDEDSLEKNEEISVLRYDKLLNEYVCSNSFSALQKMNMQYRQQTKLLIEDILSLGRVGDDTISQKLKTFYSDPTLLQIMSDVDTQFSDLDWLEEGLTKGFKKLIKEVPTLRIPTIYTQVSALNESIVLSDTLLGISLDKYLGEDYPLYKCFYYDYQRRTMCPEQILVDCFSFYLMGNYSFPTDDGSSLINVMLHYGKINYVVQQLLGASSIYEVLGYTETEQAWCDSSEKRIWEYIVSNNHKDARDPMLIRQYMRLSPVPSFFGIGAPPLIGTWIGANIISAYMEQHKEVSLQELLHMTDYKLLLQESNYLD